jgi:hypothetical protein
MRATQVTLLLFFPIKPVMAALVAAIHFPETPWAVSMDGRDKPGHDGAIF